MEHRAPIPKAANAARTRVPRPFSRKPARCFIGDSTDHRSRLGLSVSLMPVAIASSRAVALAIAVVRPIAARRRQRYGRWTAR